MSIVPWAFCLEGFRVLEGTRNPDGSANYKAAADSLHVNKQGLDVYLAWLEIAKILVEQIPEKPVVPDLKAVVVRSKDTPVGVLYGRKKFQHRRIRTAVTYESEEETVRSDRLRSWTAAFDDEDANESPEKRIEAQGNTTPGAETERSSSVEDEARWSVEAEHELRRLFAEESRKKCLAPLREAPHIDVDPSVTDVSFISYFDEAIADV